MSIAQPSPAAVRAADIFESKFGESAPVLVQAPGRVNVIGEHTDYNDGFVLPVALPFTTAIAARPRSDNTVAADSSGFAPSSFALGDDPRSSDGWIRYLHGVAWVLSEQLGHHPPGWEGVIHSDIPAGASLSSSAALEVATTLVFDQMEGVEHTVPELARIGQRVENEVMGLPSGLLDQLASAGGRAAHATLIDCRDLTMRSVPFPSGVEIVVLDTGTRRELVESEYADRQATCAAAARALGLDSLRDATLDDLDRLVDVAGMSGVEGLDDELVRRRVRHVVTENARTLDAVAAMESVDLALLGRLMVDSHLSLRDDYEVSGPALDAVVEAALECPGCLGARMTGGGFAGGAIALVIAEEVAGFTAALPDRYLPPPEQPAVEPLRTFPIVPAAGATVLRRAERSGIG